MTVLKSCAHMLMQNTKIYEQWYKIWITERKCVSLSLTSNIIKGDCFKWKIIVCKLEDSQLYTGIENKSIVWNMRI